METLNTIFIYIKRYKALSIPQVNSLFLTALLKMQDNKTEIVSVVKVVILKSLVTWQYM